MYFKDDIQQSICNTAGHKQALLSMRNTHESLCFFPKARQPEAWLPLVGVSYPYCIDWDGIGQNKGKSFCRISFSISAFILAWHHISKTLWLAMILTQTRRTDWKPHSCFEGHLITMMPTSNFGLEVNILNEYNETGWNRSYSCISCHK